MPYYLFSEIQYPESLYVEHTETGYRILLGSIPQNVEREYGHPLEKKMLFRVASGAWELWETRYSNFIIRYSTYYNEITEIILLNDTFKTSLGIKVGDTEENLIKTYGNPIDIIYYLEKRMIYDKYIPEINSDGEFTRIMFDTDGSVITRIRFSIESYA
jgi:hypothetical protein